MLIDLAQAQHPHAVPEFVQHPDSGHLAVAAQSGELPPRALLRQQGHQQVQGMDRGEQTQQMHPIQLRGGIGSTPPAGGPGRPAVIDEIVGDEWAEEFEQLSRARQRKVGIHPGSLPWES
jgi:hypothetical protein